MMMYVARFVLCVMVLGVTACGASQPTFPSAKRTAVPTLPVYPRMVADPTVIVDAEGDRMFPRQQTTFQTTDSPTEVFAFYKEQLAPQGWVIVVEDTQLLKLAAVEACPYYRLDIQVTRVTTASTTVELDLSPAECIRTIG